MKLFGPHISGRTHYEALGIELSFQNREAEIETIARVCLNNLKVSKLRSGEVSQHKTTLLTSAQMWGSGKSWLGTHFLQQIKTERYAPLRSKLAEEFGPKAVKTLIKSVYIPIDLRLWTGSLFLTSAPTLDQFVLRALVGTMVMHFPDDLAFWQSQPESYWEPKTIVAWFSKKYDKTFFVHFDEVDTILCVPPMITRDEVIGMRAFRFLEFWGLIHPIILSSNFLYVSGRSAFGKGLYHSSGLMSPGIRSSDNNLQGANTCLLLDTLKPQHIENILAENPGIEDVETRKYLASLLYYRTAGVPCFIGYAVEWLVKQQIGKNSKKQTILPNIFGDKFRDFIRDDKGARNELCPMISFQSDRIKELYARLIALSALGVPLDTNATINNPEAWGIRKDERNKHLEVPMLDLLCLYNLYIEKTSIDGPWRIIFPDIVLDEIANFHKSERDSLPGWVSSLPYWIAFSKTRSADAQKKGILMERIAANNMELAILDELGIAKQSATFEERFPFLSHSSIGKEVASLSSSHPYRQLPKIVTQDKGQGSVASLDSLTTKEREDKLQVLKTYISQPPSYLWEEIRLYKGDWIYLLKIVQPGILYVPTPKSSSADLIYFASTMNSVHFRFKAEKTLLTMDSIIIEAQKAYVGSLVADKTLTFVIVALKVNRETIEKNATPESKCIQVNQGRQHLSIVMKSGAILKSSKSTWRIPHNMDIVVVLDKGLEQLITKHNLVLFEKQTVTIEDFVNK